MLKSMKDSLGGMDDPNEFKKMMDNCNMLKNLMDECGMSPEDIKKGLEDLKKLKGQNPIELMNTNKELKDKSDKLENDKKKL